MATMIPGTTSGETMKELTALRPGKRPRTSASEAAVPRIVAKHRGDQRHADAEREWPGPSPGRAK